MNSFLCCVCVCQCDMKIILSAPLSSLLPCIRKWARQRHFQHHNTGSCEHIPICHIHAIVFIRNCANCNCKCMSMSMCLRLCSFVAVCPDLFNILLVFFSHCYNGHITQILSAAIFFPVFLLEFVQKFTRCFSIKIHYNFYMRLADFTVCSREQQMITCC